MNKFLLFTFAFLLFNISVFAQTETVASRTWEVQKYDITATLPTAETDRFLTAKAVLTLKNVTNASASRLTLRISDKAEISNIKVNNSELTVTKSQERIGTNRYLQRAAVSVPLVSPNQAVTVEVNYRLKVEENTAINSISPIGAQFLPLSFWYPTPNSWFFVRLADYAPFRLQINSANGTVISAGTNSAGGFDAKLSGQPFFAVGNWEKINAGGAEIYLPKGANADEQKRAVELASLALEAKNFATKFLGNAPDEPLKLVSVKRGAGFSGGGTILVDESAFKRQKVDSQTAIGIAEAVVKMWLGNAVKLEGDANGTLREGLSKLIATQFIEQKYGKDIADVEYLRQRTAYTAIVKRDAPLNIVSPLDDYYFSAVTNKGAMIWRLLIKNVGQDAFFKALRENAADGNLSISEMRESFPTQKEFFEYAFNQVTDMNLRVGLPQISGGEAKLALSNTGAIPANVNVVATLENGEKLNAQTTIPAKNFGEVVFRTNQKIVRAEVDAEKLYPQIDYSDDIAPRDFDDSDSLLIVKRSYDKQDFATAEKNALTVLRYMPRYDDVRILLARALLGQGKNTEAEREFRAVLDEKLPTARSLAWANVGLGDIQLKSGQKSQAAVFYTEAIKANAEYGATLAARQGRNNANAATPIEESIKAFFTQFDRAAVGGNKAALENFILSGEIPRFAGGIAGQAQEWTSKLLQVDKLDENSILAEVQLNIRLLNKSAESGMAVFRLARVGNSWKISVVEMFEVR